MLRALVFAIASVGSTAVASPSVHLVREGQTCDLAALPSRVEALLGRDPFDDATRSVVRVELQGDASQPQAIVTFDDGFGGVRGPRHLASASCGGLLEDIALVIAMGMPQDPPVSPSPAAEPAPPSKMIVDDASEPVAVHAVESRHERAPHELGVTAGGAAAVSANGWTQQAAVGLRWRRGAHSLALELRLDAPQDRVVAPMSRVTVATTMLSVVACRHVGPLGLCGAFSAGEARGTGSGLIDERTAITPTVSAGVRAGWECPLWRGLRARLEVGADAFVTSSRFDVDHMPVWTSSSWSTWAGAGAVARFL